MFGKALVWIFVLSLLALVFYKQLCLESKLRDFERAAMRTSNAIKALQ